MTAKCAPRRPPVGVDRTNSRHPLAQKNQSRGEHFRRKRSRKVGKNPVRMNLKRKLLIALDPKSGHSNSWAANSSSGPQKVHVYQNPIPRVPPFLFLLAGHRDVPYEVGRVGYHRPRFRNYPRPYISEDSASGCGARKPAQPYSSNLARNHFVCVQIIGCGRDQTEPLERRI